MTATFSYRGSRSCPHVGLDSLGGNYDGIPSWTVTRSVAQWFKLQVGSGGHSYSSHGRIYDSAASNPYWYHCPSLNVNAAGDLVAGFSGSRATEYIGAFFRGRKANGTWMTRPALVQAGRAYHAQYPSTPPEMVRWGDYSFTCVDPDGTRFWTVQEYAEVDPQRPVEPNNPVANAWGTWVTSVQP